MLIRELRREDWPQIYPFFRAVVAAGESYAYPLDLTSEQAADLWLADPPGHTVVAVDGERVLGTATTGPNRPGRGSHIATGSFLVDPGAAGRGVGRALGEHVVRLARQDGYRGIQFNAVVETNAAAVHLWRSLGFAVLATVPGAFEHPRHGFVGLHLMFLPLV